MPWPRTHALLALLEFYQRGFSIAAFGLLFLLLSAHPSVSGNPAITHDSEHKLVTLTDGTGQLVLRLNYAAGCVLDQVVVRGRNVDGECRARPGIRIGDEWFTSTSTPPINLKLGRETVTITGIHFGK